MDNGNLQEVPGIGPRIAEKLRRIGVNKLTDLKGKNPEKLYTQSCLAAGVQEDPCLLYVYRLAVYYAETKTPDPAKLQWWYWKDNK